MAEAKNLKDWHRQVCERDRYQCQLAISPECKKDYSYDYYFQEGRNVYVCGDHLKTQKARPDLRFDTTNGKCVCWPCHNWRHAKQYEVPEEYLQPAIE